MTQTTDKATPVALRERAWAKPQLDFILGRDRGDAPVFPLEVLGPFWKTFIEDAAGSHLPRDFFAGTLLGTVAGLIGNSRTVKLPAPSTQEAPATLWMINVGDPGAGKTPAFLPFVNAVQMLEDRYNTTLKIEDSTIAGAIDEMEHSPRGIFVMNDELSGWWDCFKHDRQGEQFWLKAYNGTLPYTVRRKRQTIEIPRHNLSVVGGTQPATLPTMMDATSGVERGFVSRCMFLYPNKPKGQRGTGRMADTQGAADILERIYGLQPVADWEPRRLPLDKAAAQYFGQWWDSLNEGWHDPKSPDGQFLAKQNGTALRLALVLEVLWWADKQPMDAKARRKAEAMKAKADPTRNPSKEEAASAQAMYEAFCDKYAPADGPASVTLRAMKAATALITGYFMPHFERCQEDAYQPVNTQAAVALCRVLVKRQIEAFNSRDLRQYAFGKVHHALHGNGATNTVNEVCEYLVERNVLRRVEGEAKTGRKPQTFEVNSLLATMAARALAK